MRPTTPQQPTVYRSLSSAAAASSSSSHAGGEANYRSLSGLIAKEGGIVEVTTTSASKEQTLLDNNNSKASSSSCTVPRLPMSLKAYSQKQTCLFVAEVDLKLIEAKIKNDMNCRIVEFVNEDGVCCYSCAAEAADGNESCEFCINIWDVRGDPDAPEPFLIELVRTQGCPYFFHQVSLFGLPKDIQTSAVCSKIRNRLFRVPALPANFCDKGAGLKKECMEMALIRATSDVQEQRVQACMSLADLCTGERFAEIFREVGGPERLAKLKGDADPTVRKAVCKVLAHCAV